MTRLSVISLLALLLVTVLPTLAQQVSDDAVQDVAEHMFCPVCENEPLDDCRTPTCVQWKEEIRDQLAAGSSESEIQAWFVERYGQHVLAVPSDPLLRGLSFAVPLLGTILALGVGVFALRRWQQQQPVPVDAEIPARETSMPDDDDPYRQLLERDLE